MWGSAKMLRGKQAVRFGSPSEKKVDVSRSYFFAQKRMNVRFYRLRRENGKEPNNVANQKEEIIRAAMKGVRLYGMEGLRIRHIAELSGSSVGNIYQYFNSKEHLLQVCFERVDRQLAHLFDTIVIGTDALAADPEAEIYRLWSAYFRWLVAYPDETVFYHRFRDSSTFPAFDKQRDVSYFGAFIGIIHLFELKFQIFSHINGDILWLFVLTSTVMYAKYVVEGVLPNTLETEKSIFQLEMYGLSRLVAPGQKQER